MWETFLINKIVVFFAGDHVCVSGSRNGVAGGGVASGKAALNKMCDFC